MVFCLLLHYEKKIETNTRYFRYSFLCTSILTSLKPVSAKAILLEYIQSNMSKRTGFQVQCSIHYKSWPFTKTNYEMHFENLGCL